MSDNTDNPNIEDELGKQENPEQVAPEDLISATPVSSLGSPSKSRDLVHLEKEVRQSFINYAMSVIVDRALPDVRDGLKPVHRRVLFDMHDLRVVSSGATKKSARIVGDVIGRFHPHGDSAVYDTIVRMAQDFSMREPLIFGQGNFGDIDGLGAAAMRYTEVKMTKIAEAMLEDLDKETVDTCPNYDESEQMPVVLPTRFPNLLVNGSSGIAVGMATNIPTHNLSEVIDGSVAVLDNPEITLDELMQLVPGPDFPTGGTIVGNDGIREAYATGRGRCIIRAKTHNEVDKNGRTTIYVDEIPYVVRKVDIVKQIAQLIRDKKIEGISEINDLSDKNNPVKIAIDLKRDAYPESVLNNLYQNTMLQSSFPINMVALVNGEPKTLNLKQILKEFVDFRREVVTRRTVYLLRQDRRKAHVDEGLLVAKANIQRVIDLITSSANQEEAREKLMAEAWEGEMINALIERTEEGLSYATPQGIGDDRGYVNGRYYLSEPQAKAILALQLSRLTHLAQDEIKNDYKELVANIKNYLDILNRPERLREVIREELLEIKERFGNARKSNFTVDIGKINKADLIPRKDVIVTLSAQGYIKFQDISIYESQGRGGRGKMATKLKDEDYITKVVVASTHDKMMCFTNLGRAFVSVVYDLPTSDNRAFKGVPVQNFFNIDTDNHEHITALLPISEFNGDENFFMATKKGLVKRVKLSAFASFVKRMNSNPIKAVNLGEGDELIGVEISTGDDDIYLFTSNGYAQHFCEFHKASALDSESDDAENTQDNDDNDSSSDNEGDDVSIDRHSGSGVRPSGRGSGCIRGIKIRGEGEVVSLMVATAQDVANDSQCLIASANGFGKRLKLSDIPMRNRGGMGVIIMRNLNRNGNVVGAVPAADNSDYLIISNQGQLLRSAMSDTPLISRYGAGNILMRMYEGDSVMAIQSIPEDVVENSKKAAEARKLELEAQKNAEAGIVISDNPENTEEKTESITEQAGPSEDNTENNL